MPVVRYDGHMGPELESRGPLVHMVLVSLSDPSIQLPLKMLIDTGADLTVIDIEKLRRLGTQPTDAVRVTGVNQVAKLRPVYRVGLAIGMSDKPLKKSPGGGFKPRPPSCTVSFIFRVVGMPRQGDYDGLIGRDFLANFDLRYFGKEGRFELSTSVNRSQMLSKADQRKQRTSR